MFSGKMMYFTRINHDTFTFKGIDLYVNHASERQHQLMKTVSMAFCWL